MTQVSRDALLAAFALRKAGRIADAERAFRALLAREPRHPESLHGLSLVLQDQGREGEALNAAAAAVRANPGHAGLHYTLGVMLQDGGQAAQCLLAFAQAARLKPDFFQAWNNLGQGQLGLGQTEQAVQSLRRAVEAKPDYLLGWANLARALQRLGLADEALAACARALAIDSGHESTLEVQADLYARMTHIDDAMATYEHWLRLHPDSLAAAFGAALTLPWVYTSGQHLDATRLRYGQGLDRLEADAAHWCQLHADQIFAAIDRVNFLLAYQGEDDRALQEQYARIVHGLVAAAGPQWLALPDQVPSASAPADARRPRVGFVSSFFRDCTAGQYFRSWITDLDRNEFELFAYSLGGGEDGLTEQIRQAAQYRRLTGDLPQLASAIRADALDILIYPELGMHGATFALAALRLAPIQCAAWGHPVTTGHSTIDYFLSSALMEPEGAEAHYTETLVRLPGLGTNYALPPVNARKTRTDFGLPADANLYLFPHALFKVHPENDQVLAQILAADTRGRVVVCEGQNASMTRAFLDRLKPALAACGVSADRVLVQPVMPREDFLELNRICDVMLDATRWSGGNTSLDALAAGLPIVTRAGRFMRGRQSAGMLTAIGLDELIAVDQAAYVALALVLGQDRVRRDALRRRIVAAHDQLFEDPAPVAALAGFLRSVQRQGRE